jgi:hypothetical protein
MAKRKAYRWRGFGEQARGSQRKPSPLQRPSPATNKQLRFLSDLRRRFGIPVDGLTELTKDDATREIAKLLARRSDEAGNKRESA